MLCACYVQFRARFFILQAVKPKSEEQNIKTSSNDSVISSLENY
jgi:hypothetical protein